MALSAGTVLLSIVLVRHLVTGLTCKNGYFLNENKDCIDCPEHCLFCYSDEYCINCDKGFWGKICDLSCTNCRAGTSCEKTNGFCQDGCTYGYSGILCDIKCDNKCISCTREHSQNCLKCAPGRYPSISCDKVCSGCHEQSCDETGVCVLRCVNGSWGQRCERKCPQHCKFESCDRDNGTCIFGCNDDSPGLQCNETILDSNIEDKNSTPIIAIAVPVAVIVLVGAVIGIYIYLKRKKSHQHSQRAAEEETLVLREAGQDEKSRRKKELKDIRICFRKENAYRDIQETGFQLYGCLSNCIDSLISLADPSVSTEEIKIFSSAKTLQENVVTLLNKHASSWKTMLPLLVDHFPLPESKPDEKERKNYLKYIEESYTKLMSECSEDVYNQNYTKLYLYASATCINTPIYVISVDQQWHYFEPLFSFDEQPKKTLQYITMYLSSENLFYEVKSTDRCAPPPKATGIVGMYMKCLEDTETVCISMPEELTKIPDSSKTDLCSGVGEEVIEECCDILLQTKLIEKSVHAKLARKQNRQADFCRIITTSESAFKTFCQVLIKRRDKKALSPYIQNLTLFVKSCEYLSQYEALRMLDIAIIERNADVEEFLDACSVGEEELRDTRNAVLKPVLASSSVSFGASLGVSIAGAALGIGTGVASGTASFLDVANEKLKLKGIDRVQNPMFESESKISKAIENVEEVYTTTLNKGHGSQSKDPGISRSWFLGVGAAARSEHSVASIVIAAAKIGSVAACFSATVLGPLSLECDIACLAEAAYNERKGNKTINVKLIQSIREIVEMKCKIFNNMLRGDFEGSKRMVEPFLD